MVHWNCKYLHITNVFDLCLFVSPVLLVMFVVPLLGMEGSRQASTCFFSGLGLGFGLVKAGQDCNSFCKIKILKRNPHPHNNKL